MAMQNDFFAAVPSAADGLGALGSLSRRRLLAGLGLTAGVTGALTPSVATAAAGRPATPSPSDPLHLFADPSFNYEALSALGAAGYGVSEVGEVVTAVNAINAAGLSFQTYTDTFLALADSLAARSSQALGQHRVTAGACALRAAQYYARALFFVLGTHDPSREQRIYQAGRDAWDRFTAIATPAAEQWRIPYGRTTLSAWFFRPDTRSTRRPTLIMTNGSDGQAVDLWVDGAAAGLRRGWNVLIYEGPGQGEALFAHRIPFTDRWERVVTPIVDQLVRRPDVDARRIALSGLSMGGALVARSVAFERRIAALVAMPGLVSPWAAFDPAIRSIVTADKDLTNHIWNNDVVPRLTPAQAFLLKKRYEPFGAGVMDAARHNKMFTDIWTSSQTIQRLDISAVADKIRCPTLVLDYEGEQFYPGQAQQLFDRLKAQKTYVRLTAAEGAQLHCSPMAPQRQSEVLFDFLEDALHVD